MTNSLPSTPLSAILAIVISFAVLCGVAGIGAEHLIVYLWHHIHWAKA